MSDAPVETGGGAIEPVPEGPRRSMRSLAARVLAAQAVALLLLWLLQMTFG